MPTAAPAAPVDSQTLVRTAVANLTAIATLPEVTTRIIRVVEDPKSSAQQLHKLVAHDPALVMRILKVVNSAFYGLPGQIASVERAIVLLGLNAVKNIAVAASLGQLFRGVKLCGKFSAKDLWQHCIAVAVTSRQLAKEMKLSAIDEAFLAGMIHDVGILVSMQTWPEPLRQACEEALGGASFLESERRHVGCDHQALGAALVARWQFPRVCQLVAGHHHDPLTVSRESRQVVSLVYVADTLLCAQASGFNLTAAGQAFDDATLVELGVDPSALARVTALLPQLMSEASSLSG